MEKIKDTITDMVRQATVSLIQQYSGSEEFEISPVNIEVEKEKVLSNWVVLLLITSDMFKITFKVYFNLSDITVLSENAVSIDSDTVAGKRQAIDFVKEYSNLVGGHLSGFCIRNNIEFDKSLPLSLRGFYEVFNDNKKKKLYDNYFEDIWMIRHPKTNFYCGINVDIFKMESLQNISAEESQPDDDFGGQFEFL